MAKNKKSIQISEEAWKAYTDKLYNVSATAGKKMEEYILKHGLEDRNALIDYAYGIVTKYSEGTSALAAQMYDEIAAAENAFTLSAEVIATPSYGEVAKTVHGTLKKSKNEKSLGGAIQYLVKRTGADTTLHNALRDHAQFAWIPGTGETCSFCRMLASNGWRYMSKKALKNGHAEHIHANCRCTYAIRFSEQSNINGYDPDKLYQEYVDSGRDVNEMRRLQYKNNKELAEKIKAQKREAYAKRHMDYRHERDMQNPLIANVREGEISAKGIKGSPNDIYVSDKLNIKPKKLQEIENNITEYKKLIGVDDKESPKIVLVADTELGNAGGRYVATDNVLYYKVFKDKNVERHVNLHELFHWNDAQEYINSGHVIKSDQDVIDYMCEKSKRILDKKGITADNVGELSAYARSMYKVKRFDEVYVEYRTIEGLKNANIAKGITGKT